MQFSDYKKAARYIIHDIPKTNRVIFDDAATIEKNHRIMQLLGEPQNKQFSMHIAATSGKGTICYLVNAILLAHGKTTGMIQSPHAYDIRERIQINGNLITEQQFIRSLNSITKSTSSIDMSYFETLVAMGFDAMTNTKVDYGIIETGLGGRLDATNTIDGTKKICVLGQIGLDHIEILGSTLAEIATEKAGIVQPGSKVIALKQDESVNKVFEKYCNKLGIKIQWVEQLKSYRDTNERMALTICRLLAKLHDWNLDKDLAVKSMRDQLIPGRFEKRLYNDRLFIFDGAHNPQKLDSVRQRIEAEMTTKVTVVMSLGQHKNIEACLLALQPIAQRVIATEYFTEEQDIPVRPIAANEITAIGRKLGIDIIDATAPQTAIKQALKFAEPILITGSFYLLGEVDKIIS